MSKQLTSNEIIARAEKRDFQLTMMKIENRTKIAENITRNINELIKGQ
ncbi:hypothetical protein [Moritella viscosa]|uniref:Glycerol-3-phosphate dehydrogenase [NAD(P)+]-NAD(P)H-dependent glycerol-3-phosphate dehydrogenase n=1 Tax=Moritella viscosa TaxID=80854 RepID=A0A1L0C9M4_9GAMM|nr:hypothetical protein [Moritella viscosa]SGZ17361.1 Glycerol-3-phosphate dehydrogenase [NAD(P)+]-NAD(P)H-dependent glycerol-3-phosphate dehydrogenase [Moritella viscosa]